MTEETPTPDFAALIQATDEATEAALSRICGELREDGVDTRPVAPLLRRILRVNTAATLMLMAHSRAQTAEVGMELCKHVRETAKGLPAVMQLAAVSSLLNEYKQEMDADCEAMVAAMAQAWEMPHLKETVRRELPEVFGSAGKARS